MPMATSAQSTGDWYPPSTVYIPETGQTLDQLFLDLWRNSGGADAYGYPITKEITQSNGHVVQYLQYARFEYWPEGDANGNTVFTANIGDELRPIAVQRTIASFAAKPKQEGSALETARATQAWLPVDASKLKLDDGTVTYSEETKHSVQGDFNDYWQNVIGTAYLGNPLTEQYTQGGDHLLIRSSSAASWRGRRPRGCGWCRPGGAGRQVQAGQKPANQGDVPTYSEDLFIRSPHRSPRSVATRIRCNCQSTSTSRPSTWWSIAVTSRCWKPTSARADQGSIRRPARSSSTPS